jgi:Eukaryotic aspartyl protease
MAGLEYLVTSTYSPPTLIQAMVANGDIDRESYSLYLNDQANGKGTIIFGGVDSTKYTGELVGLQTLPTDNGYSNYSAFNVALTGISIEDDSGTRLLTDSTFRTPALLDSGTTMTYLPPGVYNAISQGFGVSESYVRCSLSSSTAALIYHFGGEGGPSISVPISALMDLNDGTQYDDGTEACYFNVDVESDGSATLGDSFMRSGYFVYDLENHVVAIAQVAANITDEAITAIPSGTPIPGCSSTNTLIITETAAPSGDGAVQTASSSIGASVLPGTPTFALGAAATAGGSGSSGSGSSGASQDAAVSVRAGVWGLGMVVAVAVLVL